MKKTERIYGVPPSRYAALQIPLCELKIADANALLKALSNELDLLDPSEEMADIRLRINEATEAVKHNNELIEEAKGIV